MNACGESKPSGVESGSDDENDLNDEDEDEDESDE
jgi:hypothetical protein